MNLKHKLKPINVKEEAGKNIVLDGAEIVKQSTILTYQDLNTLLSLKNEMKHVFKHSQIFRTKTEMIVSVLNDLKFPTADSKYWQALREQNVMFHELVMLSYEYRKNLVEIKKLKRQLLQEKDELERELLEIEIEKKTFISYNQERIAKDRIRELQEWSDIKSKLKTTYSLEDCDEHQLISYTKRWIQQSIVMGGNGSPAERQNLLGQLRSGILQCIRKGIIDKVLEGFPSAVKKQIRQEYSLGGG